MTSKELIQKYLQQNLSEDERFELEKRALDDEFLAEAWEGYQLHQMADRKNVIPALEQRLNQVVKSAQKPRVISLRKYWPIAAAASVALMVAASFLLNEDGGGLNPRPDVIALEQIGLDDDIAPRITLDDEEINTDVVIQTPSEPSPAVSPEPTTSSIKAATDNNDTPKRDRAVAAAPIAVETEVATDDIASVTPDRIEESSISIESSVEGASPIALRQAIAVDDIQTPISTKKRKAIKLDGSTTNQALTNVDKTASASKRVIPISSEIDTASASPTMGWSAFQQHLCDNTEITKDALFMRGIKVTEHFVPVEFDLDDYNMPSNIRVLEHSGAIDYLSKEAVRLIRTSGKWSTLKVGSKIQYNLSLCFENE